MSHQARRLTLSPVRQATRRVSSGWSPQLEERSRVKRELAQLDYSKLQKLCRMNRLDDYGSRKQLSDSLTRVMMDEDDVDSDETDESDDDRDKRHREPHYKQGALVRWDAPVSYTHLTLPTKA